MMRIALVALIIFAAAGPGLARVVDANGNVIKAKHYVEKKKPRPVKGGVRCVCISSQSVC
jgi:hypothetical protein